MHLNISFKHMDASETLKEYIETKSIPLQKFFRGNFSVSWNLMIEKQNRVAHCHVVGNHINYFAQAQCEGFHASIDSVIEKIETQMRKHKELITEHHSRKTQLRPVSV